MGAPTLRVHTVDGLSRLRKWARGLSFDAADQFDGSVYLTANGQVAAIIDAPDPGIRWAAEQVCAAILIRRDDGWEGAPADATDFSLAA